LDIGNSVLDIRKYVKTLSVSGSESESESKIDWDESDTDSDPDTDERKRKMIFGDLMSSLGRTNLWSAAVLCRFKLKAVQGHRSPKTG